MYTKNSEFLEVPLYDYLSKLNYLFLRQIVKKFDVKYEDLNSFCLGYNDTNTFCVFDVFPEIKKFFE